MNLWKILCPGLAVFILWMGLTPSLYADESRLDFNEVFELLKSQLKETPVEDLEDAAARGLIQSLAPQVRLGMGAEAIQAPDWPTNALNSQVFEDVFGYLHISDFAPGIVPAAREAIRGLTKNPSLQGLILDLRFSQGTHYTSATGLADLFFDSEEPLLNYGDGLKSSTAKTNAIQLPMAILINQQTRGAAEALAAILHEGGIGLLIGDSSAGEATIYREFKLAQGPSLWIAVEPVKTGKNTPLPRSGLTPDIALKVPESDERQWLEDPYADLAQTDPARGQADAHDGSQPTSRSSTRLSEADLVRMMREGEEANPDDLPSETSHTAPLVQDQALARALDFFKALAVIQKFKGQ